MTLKKIENLIGLNINDLEESTLDIDDEIKVTTLEYGTKHCGKRFPREKLFLANIDFFNIISFDKLFSFEYLLIFWYKDDIITDIELYDIAQDIDVLKKDYKFIKNQINLGNAYKISEGDTSYLGAGLREGKSKSPNSTSLSRNRSFVLKKKYLQKIIDELGFVCRY